MPITPVDQIIVRKRLRNIDLKKVQQLSESISEIGLINPIQINGKTLVAGAHRLAATKLLGIETIITNSVGIKGDNDSFRLIEIDENLFRNELSASEKSQHITERIDILKRKKGINSDEKVNLIIEKEIKENISENLGISINDVNKEISNHLAVTNAGLDQNELENLSKSQYERVAKIAKKDGKEAALNELNIQLNKPKGKSIVSHDATEHLKQEIQKLKSARSICTKYNNQIAINAINALINILKDQAIITFDDSVTNS